MQNMYAFLIATDMQPRFRVLVHSERLEEAPSILAHPIPPDIVAESKDNEPEYQPPACRTHDPILEGVEPSTSR